MDIFGIVLDADNSMMWWIENKGVANGERELGEERFTNTHTHTNHATSLSSSKSDGSYSPTSSRTLQRHARGHT